MAASVSNVWYTAASIASSSGLPLFNQCLSWIILRKFLSISLAAFMTERVMLRSCVCLSACLSVRLSCKFEVKGKGKRSIAVRKKPHHYGNSHAIWDHTVLLATRQRWYSRLHPSRSWYWIKWPRRDARLSWPSWLVTARDGIPARRRSPIPVVTGPDVC